MITVTDSAAKQLSSLIEESGFTTPYVRVAVKGGGCSGLSYDLSFDTEQNYDFLKIYDGPDQNSPLIISISGILYPTSFIANSGNVFFN